jgi:hypothetical protein
MGVHAAMRGPARLALSPGLRVHGVSAHAAAVRMLQAPLGLACTTTSGTLLHTQQRNLHALGASSIGRASAWGPTVLASGSGSSSGLSSCRSCSSASAQAPPQASSTPPQASSSSSSAATTVQLEPAGGPGACAVRLETGRLAGQADGAVHASSGSTHVLATVVVNSEVVSEEEMLPLQVDFLTGAYVNARLPDTLDKRDRSGDEEVLAARAIDRALRPLFPPGFRYETHVVTQVRWSMLQSVGRPCGRIDGCYSHRGTPRGV